MIEIEPETLDKKVSATTEAVEKLITNYVSQSLLFQELDLSLEPIEMPDGRLGVDVYDQHGAHLHLLLPKDSDEEAKLFRAVLFPDFQAWIYSTIAGALDEENQQDLSNA